VWGFGRIALGVAILTGATFAHSLFRKEMGHPAPGSGLMLKIVAVERFQGIGLRQASRLKAKLPAPSAPLPQTIPVE
jgi:hypothetical protein